MAISRPTTTYNVQLSDLGRHDYVLKVPLECVLEGYPEEVIATLPSCDLYAIGETDSQAMANLKTEIVDMYERLEEIGVEKLGPYPLRWLLTLRASLIRTTA